LAASQAMRLAGEVAAACEGVAGAADLINSECGLFIMHMHVCMLHTRISAWVHAMRLAGEVAAACEGVAGAAELVNSECG
jgi:hypothetical protein